MGEIGRKSTKTATKGKTANKRSKAVKKKTGTSRKKRRKKRLRRWPVVILLLIAFLIYGSLMAGKRSAENRIEEVNAYKHDFISKVSGQAEEEYVKNGVLPSITISQAILESNWGNSRLAQEGNNLFGIKADKSWHGEKINFSTTENYNDRIYADFRKYSSWNESISDYASFLRNNKRYEQHGMFDSNDYRKQAQALEDAGYATAKNERGEKVYAERLIGVIEKYDLRKYDMEAIRDGN